MKIKMIVCSTVALACLTGCININERHECHKACCEKGEHHEKGEKGEDNERGEGEKGEQAKLMSKAKLSKEAAEQIALSKVPNGTVKEAELENEKGKLIWSFGFATPDSVNTTEVNVDAITGNIVNMEQETPQAEAKEAAEDAAKAKPAKEDDDKD